MLAEIKQLQKKKKKKLIANLINHLVIVKISPFNPL